MANIKSFPNNQDEYIGAEYVMRWLHGRTSGVFGAYNNANVSAVRPQFSLGISVAQIPVDRHPMTKDAKACFPQLISKPFQ